MKNIKILGIAAIITCSTISTAALAMAGSNVGCHKQALFSLETTTDTSPSQPIYLFGYQDGQTAPDPTPFALPNKQNKKVIPAIYATSWNVTKDHTSADISRASECQVFAPDLTSVPYVTCNAINLMLHLLGPDNKPINPSTYPTWKKLSINTSNFPGSLQDSTLPSVKWDNVNDSSNADYANVLLTDTAYNNGKLSVSSFQQVTSSGTYTCKPESASYDLKPHLLHSTSSTVNINYHCTLNPAPQPAKTTLSFKQGGTKKDPDNNPNFIGSVFFGQYDYSSKQAYLCPTVSVNDSSQAHTVTIKECAVENDGNNGSYSNPNGLCCYDIKNIQKNVKYNLSVTLKPGQTDKYKVVDNPSITWT